MNDILDRIRKMLAETTPFPWGYGCDPGSLSERAERAWKLLTEEERLAISRKNPFRRNRDEVLRGLHQSGLIYRILSELSGLTSRTVERKCSGKRSRLSNRRRVNAEK